MLLGGRKRQRASNARSKSGCLTCRRCRVKCDETRPRCRRCERLCYNCNYVSGSPLIKSGSRDESIFEAAVALNALKVTTYNIPFHAPGDANQRKALHYYYTYASADLAGLMTIGFWDCVVLQKIQTDSVVRHSVIAVSQAHFERVCLSHDDNQITSAASLYGTEAYTKAITALRRYMRSQGQLSREVVLVCCVLFHTIEMLRGDSGRARLHMENGIAILKAWQLEVEDRSKAAMSGEHMYDITIVFGRLDFSATLEDSTRVPQLEYLDSYEAHLSVKDARLEVRNARDAYALKVHNGIDRWKYLARYSAYRDTPISQVPSSIMEAKLKLEERHRATEQAVAELISSQASHTSNPKNIDAIKTTKTLLVVLFQTLIGLRQLSESLTNTTSTSLWDVQPEHLLHLAEEAIDLRVLAKEAQDFASYGSFSPEVGMCCSLLLLAHRTSSPGVREKAVALARRAAKQEGLVGVARAGLEWFEQGAEGRFVVLWKGPGH